MATKARKAVNKLREGDRGDVEMDIDGVRVLDAAIKAALRDRTTHTGVQAAASISDFAATVRGTMLTAQSEVYLSGYAGYDGTGATNSDAAFLAAIADLPNGGTIWIPMGGRVSLATALIVTKPITFRAQSRTSVVTTATPEIKWTGAADATMFTIRPASPGAGAVSVFGGGSVNVDWNGNGLAATAIHLDTTWYSEVAGNFVSTKVACVLISSTSGNATWFSMKNHIRSIYATYNALVACEGTHILWIKGNGATIPSTHQFIGDLVGVVKNGTVLRIEETDNCQVQNVHGIVVAGGTGCTAELKAGGAQDSNNTLFVYAVGSIKQDNGIYGTTVLHYVSEAGGISQVAGSSRWDGELLDFITGRRFKSHTYKLRKKIQVSAGAFVSDATGTALIFGGNWRAFGLADAATQYVCAVIPADYDIDEGTITKVEFLLGSIGASAGNYRLQLDLSTAKVGNSAEIVTPEITQLLTTAAGAANVLTTAVFTLGTPLVINAGDHIFLRLGRIGADAADTNTDTVAVLGARVFFEGLGPNSAGSGTYYIPEW